jgi:predicted nuclease with TOPRIM domain
LVFANLLFKKRELLTKRNEILENTVVNIAKTIEGEDAPDSTPPSVEKDISDVTDRELVNPEKLAMLENYPISLEQQNLPALDLDNNKMRLQLRSYYVVGPDGEYKIDELTQKPATKGDGSMVAVLENVFDRAKTQQAKLNKTRAELTKLREMLSTTVDDVNALKVAGRTDKKSLTEKGEMITTLQGEKETLEANVAKLTAEKRELNAELADSRNAVETLNEDKLALEEKLTEAKEKNADWEKRWKGLKNTPSGDPDVVVVTSMTAGEKGKIIEVNDELKFAILEFSNEAIEEILGTERQNPLPQLEMNVRRPGHQSASGEFITRIKLRQVVRDKNLIVADILSDWQQTAVEKGDVVFF